MHVLRGRAAHPAADAGHTQALVDRTRETGEAGLRVWYPPEQIAFGRRDAAAEGYETARKRAIAAGYPVHERRVGGRAVAFTGEVLAFVRATPTTAERTGIGARYERAIDALADGLATAGAATARGEPEATFCPGTHSLRADSPGSGKLAGLAQRVHADVAVLAGAVVATNAGAVYEALAPVYDALDLPLEPAAIASVGDAGGDPAAIRSAVETALMGDRTAAIETIDTPAP